MAATVARREPPVVISERAEGVPIDLDAVQRRSHLPVLDGEVIAVDDGPLLPTVGAHPGGRRLRQSARDDPFWVLVSASIALMAAMIGTIVYGIVTTVHALSKTATTHASTIQHGMSTGAGIALLILVALLVSCHKTRCPGLHCRGCQRQ